LQGDYKGSIAVINGKFAGINIDRGFGGAEVMMDISKYLTWFQTVFDLHMYD
jgi:hypothetical protein